MRALRLLRIFKVTRQVDLSCYSCRTPCVCLPLTPPLPFLSYLSCACRCICISCRRRRKKTERKPLCAISIVCRSISLNRLLTPSCFFAFVVRHLTEFCSLTVVREGPRSCRNHSKPAASASLSRAPLLRNFLLTICSGCREQVFPKSARHCSYCPSQKDSC